VESAAQPDDIRCLTDEQCRLGSRSSGLYLITRWTRAFTPSAARRRLDDPKSFRLVWTTLVA